MQLTLQGNLGEISEREGIPSAALAGYRAALGLSWEIRGLYYVVSLIGYVACPARHGDATRAARLFGAAAAGRKVTGLNILASVRVLHDRVVTETQAKLGEEAFAAVREAGRALSLEVAVAEALAPATAPP